MACGCAYVSADYGGQKEYSQDGINVLLSRPKDVEGMLRNVIKVFDNDQLRINLAKAGRAEIKKRDWSNSVQLFEDILKSNFLLKNSFYNVEFMKIKDSLICGYFTLH